MVTCARAQLVGTFNTGNEGWRYLGLDSPFLFTPTPGSMPAVPFVGDYGNPPGSVGWASDPGGYQYWVTPSAWSGNMLAYYDGTASWDYWYYTSTGSWTDTWGDIAIRTTGGQWLVADVTTGAPTAATSATDNLPWNKLSVRLNTSANWRWNNVSGSLATATDIQNALASVSYLAIRGEVRQGQTEVMRLDNFRMQLAVPEFGTLAPMGAFLSMGMGWVSRRGRRQRS